MKLSLVLLAALASANTKSFNIYKSASGGYEVVEGSGRREGWLASGNFSDAAQEPSFFGQLTVETRVGVPDPEQAFAAGFLEGYATHARIFQHYNNMKCQVNCSGDPGADSPVVQWIKEQDKWVEEQAREQPEDSTLRYVMLLRRQLAGVREGYNAAAADDRKLSEWAFTLINGIGDFFDIIPAVKPSARPDVLRMSRDRLQAYRLSHGHCSALVKVTGDLSELYIGHSSWFTYSAMLRIFKHYNLRYADEAVRNRRVSFSSYPGMLSSLDDFYQMHDTQMVMVQTTNSVLDAKVYDLVTPRALLAWHRVISANALATRGSEWSQIIARYNSGSYNNQYMVADMKRFTPGNALPEGLLWVTEQMPGLVKGGDTTDELRRGYWPSYNVPYWPEIYDKSGYTLVDKRDNQTAGSQYELAPRAKIFRRDAGKVEDLKGYKAILRYNDYKNDPYSGGSPFGAICSRGDLSSSKPTAGGCYDTKVTSFTMFKRGQAQIINGPTTSGGILPPFAWEGAFEKDAHVGMPDVFNFSFQEVKLPRAWAA